MAIKRQGQLYEKNDTLAGRVNQLDLDTAPTSPLGAAKIGTSPDVQKMMGTPAQKNNAVRQAVSQVAATPQPGQAQTLQQATKQAGPQQATTAAKEAQEKATQLRQLGSLSGLVQSRIESMIAGAPQVQTGVAVTADRQQVAQSLGLGPDQQAAAGPQLDQVIAAINQYMAEPSEAKLVELVSLGLPKTEVYRLTGLTETGDALTEKAFADAVADSLTVADLDLTETGFASVEELSAALGQDAAGMTVPELQAAVADLEQQEFSQIENLRAELAGLPQDSAAAEVIRQRLRGLGDQGITGAEQAAEETTAAIDTAGTVTIAGNEYEIAELLKDEALSNIIREFAAATPDEQDKMLPPEQYGELRDWIESNKEAIGQLKLAGEATTKTFEEANREWSGFDDETGMSPELISILGTDYDPDATVTSEQMSALRDQVASTGIGQIALGGKNPTLIADLDPASAEMMKDWSPELVESSYETAQQVMASPILLALTNADISNKFLTVEEMQAVSNMTAAATALGRMPRGEELIRDEALLDDIRSGRISTDFLDAKYEDALATPAVRDLITDGTITVANRDQMLSNLPAKLRAYEKSQAAQERIRSAGNDIEQLIDAMFPNDDLDAAQIQEQLDAAELAATFGDPAAKAKADSLRPLLDPAYYQQYLADGQRNQDATLEDILKMKDPAAATQLTERTGALANPYQPTGDMVALTKVAEDGQITGDELLGNPYAGVPPLEPRLINKLYSDPTLMARFNMPPVEEYAAALMTPQHAMPTAQPLLEAVSTVSDADYQKDISDRLAHSLYLSEQMVAGTQQFSDVNGVAYMANTAAHLEQKASDLKGQLKKLDASNALPPGMPTDSPVGQQLLQKAQTLKDRLEQHVRELEEKAQQTRVMAATVFQRRQERRQEENARLLKEYQERQAAEAAANPNRRR